MVGRKWAELGKNEQHDWVRLDYSNDITSFFSTVKFCVYVSNPFKICCFSSLKKFPQRNLLPFWISFTHYGNISNAFECWGFCATAICTNGLCHLEINKGFLYQLFLRNSLLFVNFFVRNWNLFVCFCRGAKAPYRQKQKKVSVPFEKVKKKNMFRQKKAEQISVQKCTGNVPI